MECNRDEAERAKDIAEQKLTAKDIMGAKKFAVKAQSLYPELDGIQQMLAALDVYISAQNRTNGEADWYGILGVHPRADDEAIRKQYRKLALMLHPDKNKSIVAEGAFKHISEAWSLLSDKHKRSLYDQKRNSKPFKQRFPPANGVPPAPPPSSNGNHASTKKTIPVKEQRSKTPKTKVGSGAAPSREKSLSTFWTICLRCNMQYEHLRVYINNNILCPSCQEPFFAAEIPPPACTGTKASTQLKHPQKSHGSNHQGASKNVSSAGGNKSGTPNAGSGGFCSQSSSTNTLFQWNPDSKTDEAANKVQPASLNVQSKHEELQAGRKTEKSPLKKSNDVKNEKSINDHVTVKESAHTLIKTGTETTGLSGVEIGSSEPNKTSGVKKRKGLDDRDTVKQSRDTIIKNGTETIGLSGVKNGSSEPNKTSGVKKAKITHLENQNSLISKARMEIRTKLTHWKSLPESSVEGKENVSDRENEGKAINNGMVNGARQDYNNCKPDAVGTLTKQPLEESLMNVPDAEFHDFDKDRTEKCFGENQVWTAYDGDDGMPRHYAMIHSVMSRNPFKMRISWLNSKTNSELGPLNWVGSGFSKTCGDFWIGKHEINGSLNSFSHKVSWKKGARGAVRIFPGKGDVWAVYRNWSPDWNELTADVVIHKYDMVKVLEDYNEELGVTVTPLVKVAGFKTVFHQHLDPKEVRTIPREEIFRFSHHVPSCMLSGQEAPNAPKGCLELDPAAIPEELLHVIKDITEEDIMQTEEKAKLGKVVDDVGGSREEISRETPGRQVLENISKD